MAARKPRRPREPREPRTPREAAEARAEKEALLTEIKALGNKQKITPADVKAVAEKHEKQRGKPAPKKE
jgi:hypothetical protein